MRARDLRRTGLAAVLPLLLLARTGRAEDEDEPGDAPAAATSSAATPEDPPGLAIETAIGRVMEFQGRIEAGYRWVSDGDEGRYTEDLNLDQGLRLFRFELEGTATGEDPSLQSLAFRASGLGDPHRRYEIDARGADGFRARIHRDSFDYVHTGSLDSRPFDTTRETTGALLRFSPADHWRVTLSTDFFTREGDATLSHHLRGDRPLPVAAPIDAARRDLAVAVDGASGAFRWGVSHSTGRGHDDSFRSLDRPDTPVDDLGTYRVDSDLVRSATAVRGGVSLWKGLADLQMVAGYSSAENDAVIRGSEQAVEWGPDGMPGTGDESAYSAESRGRSETRFRSRTLRAELTLRPADRVDVVLHAERREDTELASLDLARRDQVPPFSDPSAPWFTFRQRFRSSADQDRDGGDVVWRANDDWRFRAGVESIRERIFAGGDRRKASSPRTTVLTGGADWEPSKRFDTSLLVRHAESGGTVSRLGTGTGDSITFRGRGRFDGGWTASTQVRWKAREEDHADSRVRNDVYGLTVGRTTEKGWFTFSAFRHRYRVASDTRFVVDLAIDPTKRLRRVHYDEVADTLALDVSRDIGGPLRLFGSGRWTHAVGDLPALGRDASLGLGWRLSPALEVMLEGRSVAWTDETGPRDAYRAEMLTLSFALTF